jgi:hypothetical protein
MKIQHVNNMCSSHDLSGNPNATRVRILSRLSISQPGDDASFAAGGSGGGGAENANRCHSCSCHTSETLSSTCISASTIENTWHPALRIVTNLSNPYKTRISKQKGKPFVWGRLWKHCLVYEVRNNIYSNYRTSR